MRRWPGALRTNIASPVREGFNETVEDYGLWLMKRRDWDAAQREFEAILRLEPGNPTARQNLAWLQGEKRRGP